MHEHPENQNLSSRGQIVHQYTQALFNADNQTAAQILESIGDDPQLQAIIQEINQVHQQSEHLKIVKDTAELPKTKIRVVIVEDHELTRVGIRTTLGQNPEIEIVGEAEDASNALKLVKNLKPDIAIVDISLPDKDGIELTRYIKTTIAKQSKTVKVLILTLRNNKENVLSAFAVGADSYCMKDIKYDYLVEAVRVTCSGNSWIDPAIAHIVLEAAQTNYSKPLKNCKLTQDTDTFLDEDLKKFYVLTQREGDVLRLIVLGLNNASIAKSLFITVGTVKSHVRSILFKLGVNDRTQAAVRALIFGLVDISDLLLTEGWD